MDLAIRKLLLILVNRCFGGRTGARSRLKQGGELMRYGKLEVVSVGHSFEIVG